MKFVVRRFTPAVIDITSLAGRLNAGVARFHQNTQARRPRHVKGRDKSRPYVIDGY